MYGHVSVWLHESYEGYRSLEKYCIMIKCYGVTGKLAPDDRKKLIFNHQTPMYGHVSVWLHESYEGYGSLEKYCIMIKCYGVTG